jgi:hypothetical protein
MKLYIGNAFSLAMLSREHQAGTPNGYTPHAEDAIAVARIPRPVENPRGLIEDYVESGARIISLVGHEDTAVILGLELARPLLVNRSSISLGPDEKLLVGQLMGPRLPPGTTTLPLNAKIEWWII